MSLQTLKRYILPLSIVIILFAGLLFFRGVWKNDGKDQDRRGTVKVKRGAVVSKILGTGVVNPLNQINIYSKRGGKIIKVQAKEGDSVARGEILLLLDKEEALNSVDQAKANIREAEAEIQQANIRLEYARSNLENSQELFKKSLIAKYELEQAKRDYEIAKIQLETARSSRLHTARGNYSSSLNELEDTIIRAPISGIVVKKGVVEGEIITPMGRPLLVMQDLRQMVIKTEINEIDINRIKVGQTVEIDFDAIKKGGYHGLVNKIATAGNLRGNIVTYDVEITLVDSDERIKPEMTCNLGIIVAKAENVLYLPVDTIRREDNKNSVLIRDGDNFIWKEVNVGIANENYIVIERGLKENDEIKILSQAGLKEGTEEGASVRPSRDFK